MSKEDLMENTTFQVTVEIVEAKYGNLSPDGKTYRRVMYVEAVTTDYPYEVLAVAKNYLRTHDWDSNG